MILLFDFDGTIADSFQSFVDIVGDVTKKYGLPHLSDSEIEKLRSENPRTIIKKLHIPLYKIPLVARKMRTLQKTQIDKIKPFPGIIKMLLALKEEGHILGIVTSNGRDNVEFFLEKHNLSVFEYIFSDSSMFGKDKVIRKFLEENNLRNEDVLYIGDEIRDIEACKKVGVKIISVTWGFNTKEGIVKYNPDSLIDEPSELLTILRQRVL